MDTKSILRNFFNRIKETPEEFPSDGRNYRRCPHCRSIILLARKKCPECGMYVHKHLEVLGHSPRNVEIAEKLESGRYTLEQVGAMYGVTRERVRQIHKKITGKPARARLSNLQEIRKERKARIDKTLAYYCKGCQKPVLHKDRKVKFCDTCWDIRFNQERNPNVTLKCRRCKRDFHPFSNWKSPSVAGAHKKGVFCCQHCYWFFGREKAARKLYKTLSGKEFDVTTAWKALGMKSREGAFRFLTHMYNMRLVARRMENNRYFFAICEPIEVFDERKYEYTWPKVQLERRMKSR